MFTKEHGKYEFRAMDQWLTNFLLYFHIPAAYGQTYVRFHLAWADWAGNNCGILRIPSWRMLAFGRLGRVPVVSHVGTHSSLPGEGPIVRRIIVCDVLGIFWGEMD